MTALRVERRLAEAWRRRFVPGRRPTYELRANRSLSAAPAVVIGDAPVLRRLRTARAVVVGDDRLVPSDRRKAAELLAQAGFRRGDLLLTDRRLGDEGADWIASRARFVGRSTDPARRDGELSSAVRRGLARGRRVFVSTGALRIAPCHLPARLGVPDALFLSLQAGPLRWRTGRTEGWADLGGGVLAWLAHPPLLSLEARRLHHLGCAPPLDPRGLPGAFHGFVAETARLFGGARPPKPRIVQPFGPAPLAPLAPLLERHLFRGESLVLPGQGIVLLATLDRASVAEEAAHWLRLAGLSRPADGPFAAAVEEAFAFLASRRIDPGRRLPRPGPGRGSWARIHLAGYRLGDRLDQRFRASAAARRRIRELWKVRPSSEPEARLLFAAMASL